MKIIYLFLLTCLAACVAPPATLDNPHEIKEKKSDIKIVNVKNPSKDNKLPPRVLTKYSQTDEEELAKQKTDLQKQLSCINIELASLTPDDTDADKRQFLTNKKKKIQAELLLISFEMAGKKE